MLALFKLNFKHKKNKNISLRELSHSNQDIDINPLPEKNDDEALKKSIAVKLAGYRPLEREANFKGPKYFQ